MHKIRITPSGEWKIAKSQMGDMSEMPWGEKHLISYQPIINLYGKE